MDYFRAKLKKTQDLGKNTQNMIKSTQIKKFNTFDLKTYSNAHKNSRFTKKHSKIPKY